MKRPTDKEIRLYRRLSDVDGDLTLDSALPPKAASSASGRRGLRGLLARPQAASVAIFTLLVALTVTALLVTMIPKKPREAPPHGTQSEASGTVQEPLSSDGETESTTEPDSVIVDTPTYENAASLKKGMAMDQMLAIMGSGYTQAGNDYTFTLDTGESLTVTVEEDGTGEATVTGFTWLGETAKKVNPMDIDPAILHKVQEHATDRVVPIYVMESLIRSYMVVSYPAEGILKYAEVEYLRSGADGEIAILDAEGHGAGGVTQEGFSHLENVPALFDESVRVRAYYPILASLEGWAVYIRTSIGDYILYLHGNGSDGDAASTPYLIPAGIFHRFAYRIAYDHDRSHDELPERWDISEAYLNSISPYAITAEGYQKPINLATPEAAEKVTVGSHYSDWAHVMGNCLGCGRNVRSVYNEDTGEYGYATTPSDHLHYWELTDGRGLVVGMKMTESHADGSRVYRVSVVSYTDSADVLYTTGKPSVAVVSLLREGMSRDAVYALIGADYTGNYSDEKTWSEGGLAHTCTLTWSRYTTEGTNPKTEHLLDTYTHSTQTVESILPNIQVGVSFADIVSWLGPCRDGHEVDYWGGTNPSGYHFWELPDGRCLAAYVGYDTPVRNDPFGINYENHHNMSIMQILWLDSAAEIEAIGTPGLARAQCIGVGMKPAVLTALMGEPTATVSTLASVWEWSEDGKDYTCVVYLQNNLPYGFFKNFDSVYRCEITEGTLSSLPIPDKDPSPEDAARVTLGMTASDLIKIMGSRVQRTTLVDAELYCWTLTDGRAFCALTEGDVTDPEQDERVVTYTFYRGSMEVVSVATAENIEAVTEGMSLATVYALLGAELWEHDYDYPSSLTAVWGTMTDDYREITVVFEATKHPETNRKRAYVTSIDVYK